MTQNEEYFDMVFEENTQGFDAEFDGTQIIHDNGATFTPHVSDDGVLSWTNDRDLPNPPPINIKGKDGADGVDGKDGAKGADGISATHEWNGTILTVISASGTSSADLKGEKGDTGAQGIQGEKGDTGADGQPGKDGSPGKDGAPGADGHTPVRGEDYWTEADKAEIKAYVDEAILGGAW